MVQNCKRYWLYQSIKSTGSCQRTIRTKGNIQKINTSNRLTKVSLITKNRSSLKAFLVSVFEEYSEMIDVGLWVHNIQNANYCSLMSINKKRVKFVNWIRTKFRKENTMKILFSDEKMFDIDGIYNFQNHQIWKINRSVVDTKGGIRQKRKFPQKVMIWLGVCFKGVSATFTDFRRCNNGWRSIHQRGAFSCSQVW